MRDRTRCRRRKSLLNRESRIGWLPQPTTAVFESNEQAFRELLSADAIGSLEGSMDSREISDYYVSPYDIGSGRHQSSPTARSRFAPPRHRRHSLGRRASLIAWLEHPWSAHTDEPRSSTISSRPPIRTRCLESHVEFAPTRFARVPLVSAPPQRGGGFGPGYCA